MSFLLPIALVIAAGLALGQVKVRGVSLGVAGVLFAGLLLGHFAQGTALAPDAHDLGALRDLGLVLFVYAVGAQVGPGFVQSLRQGGLVLNALAVGVVVIGALLAVALSRGFGLDMAGMAGVFSGATTNTPSLGAGQQALDSIANVDAARRGLPGLGYAVAYPFGVVGVIITILAVRTALGKSALDDVRAEAVDAAPKLLRRAFVLENANLDGFKVAALPALAELGVLISRVLGRDSSEVHRANPDTILHTGDSVLAVGEEAALEQARAILGSPSTKDLMVLPGRVSFARLVVTHKEMAGRTLAELAFEDRFGVTVTRLRRGEVELLARPSLRLRFGDQLYVVGAPDDLAAAGAAAGNSEKALAFTDFLPIFLGVAVGLLLGSISFPVPGLPAPVKLGLAGGPLLAAIALGRIGKIGPIVWHLPGNVNSALRELGIALFLAAVGLTAGSHLVDALSHGGPQWLLCGIVITVVPLVIVAAFARLALRLDLASIVGLIAGSMTDPPALAFANSLVGADAPALAYAAVYPTTMVLRILSAQAMVLWFCS